MYPESGIKDPHGPSPTVTAQGTSCPGAIPAPDVADVFATNYAFLDGISSISAWEEKKKEKKKLPFFSPFPFLFFF